MLANRCSNCYISSMNRMHRRNNLQRLIRERADGKQAEFAERIGRSPSYVGQLVRGVGSFGERVARDIEARLGLPAGWLDAPPAEENPRAGLCPLLSWVAAGSWAVTEGGREAADAQDWLACPVAHGPDTFVLRVRGESMYNPLGRRSFADGDLIFVDPGRRAENRSLVVVIREDDAAATFKELVMEGEPGQDQPYLKPLNPNWPEPMMPLDESARLCGVVIFQGVAL